MAEAFFDTNILVYLVANDPLKAQTSRDLLARGGTISVQVLNEFASVCLGKRGLDWDTLDALLDGFRANLRVEALTQETQSRAMQLARRHRLAVYDATIIAAAAQAGCGLLYSEDLQHGATIAGVEIRNPY